MIQLFLDSAIVTAYYVANSHFLFFFFFELTRDV